MSLLATLKLTPTDAVRAAVLGAPAPAAGAGFESLRSEVQARIKAGVQLAGTVADRDQKVELAAALAAADRQRVAAERLVDPNARIAALQDAKARLEVATRKASEQKARADARSAVLALRGPLTADLASARMRYAPLAADLQILEKAMSTATGANKAGAEKRKLQVDKELAAVQGRIKQLDTDLQALDDPRSSEATFHAILGRQKSTAGAGSFTEVDRHDDKLEQKKTENRTTTTTSELADGKATAKVTDKTTSVGLDGITRKVDTTTSTVAGNVTKTRAESDTATMGKNGIAFERVDKRQTEKDGKSFGVEQKTSTQVGGAGASTSTSTTVSKADGSSKAVTKSGGVERGDGKAGATRTSAVTKTDAAGNETTRTGTTKGGVIAGKDGIGGFGETESGVTKKSAGGMKTGVVAGLAGNIVCNVVAEEGIDPPMYLLTLAVELGGKLGASHGYDKEPGKDGSGQPKPDEQTRGTVGVNASVSAKLTMEAKHRLDGVAAAAYVAALKSGNGSDKEFAIIRCGLSKGWAAARDLYLGASGKALSVAEANKLAVGESTKTGSEQKAGAGVSAGVKEGGFGGSVQAGYEKGATTSNSVAKEKDGTLTYDSKRGNSVKGSGGATVNAGMVEGGFSASRTWTTSTGYKISIDPNDPKADEMQKALAACAGQAELDAFAKKYPKAVKEKTRTTGVADQQDISAGIGKAKGELSYGHGTETSETRNDKNEVTGRKVVGNSNAGVAFSAGDLKAGASTQAQVVAETDATGKATADVSRTDTSSDAAKWLEAHVPFAGGDKKEKGALAKLTKAPTDTDRKSVSGIKLGDDDLRYLGALACEYWSRWMASCNAPADRADWISAGRKIQKAKGSAGAVAEALAGFVGADSRERNDVIQGALRRKAGDVSGGGAYEFPGELASIKGQFDKLVFEPWEQNVFPSVEKDGLEKATAAVQDTLKALDSMYAAIDRTKTFAKASAKAEMLGAINERKQKIKVALRQVSGSAAAGSATSDALDRYNDLLKNCRNYQAEETAIFAKIDKNLKSFGNEAIANVKLINDLRAIHTIWSKDYDEMAGLAQEHKWGADIYWHYKPDAARLAEANKGHSPGEKKAATPETADKRKKPEPISEAKTAKTIQEIDNDRIKKAKAIELALPGTRKRTMDSGNRLEALTQKNRNAAATKLFEEGAKLFDMAEANFAKCKPNDVPNMEDVGTAALERYRSAAALFAKGLALF